MCLFVQMLSGQLLTTAWLPPAWSMRRTWWCPSTTWTTSSTRTKMIWRLVETMPHTAINISVVWHNINVCVCVSMNVWHSCARAVSSSVHHQLTILTTHCNYSKSMSCVMLTCRPHRCEKYNRNEFRAVLLTDTLSYQNGQVLKCFSFLFFFFFVSTAWFPATGEWNGWEIWQQGTKAIHFGPCILH